MTANIDFSGSYSFSSLSRKYTSEIITWVVQRTAALSGSASKMSGAQVGSTKLAVTVANVSQNREQVFPTRQSLGVMKAKLKGAQTGHDLLKRKSEALTKFVIVTTIQSVRCTPNNL